MNSPAAINVEEQIRVKEEITYTFVNAVQAEAKRVAKGLILKERDFNSPQKWSSVKKVNTSQTPTALHGIPSKLKAMSSRQDNSSRSRSRNATPARLGTPAKKSKLVNKHATPLSSKKRNIAAAKHATPGSAKKRLATPTAFVVRSQNKSASIATNRNTAKSASSRKPRVSPFIVSSKTTVAYRARLQLMQEARELRAKKQKTPISRFERGSIYDLVGKDSPHKIEFPPQMSSLSTKGGYFSRTPRPKAKVATEIAALEEIGLSHVTVEHKGMSFAQKKKNPALFDSVLRANAEANEGTPKMGPNPAMSDSTAPTPAEPKSAKDNLRRRSVSQQLAAGISHRLSSSNARIMASVKQISCATELISHQMDRALKYLDYHLQTDKGVDVMKNVAADKFGKSSNEVTEDETAAARLELEHMLTDAVHDHCNKWWAANMAGAKKPIVVS